MQFQNFIVSLFYNNKKAEKQLRYILRGGAVVARRAHNPEVIGSNPVLATKVYNKIKFGLDERTSNYLNQ